MRTDIYRKFADWIATGSLHLNAWMMLASPSAAEILADTSFDSVTIDMQHGQASVSDMMLAIAVVASADKPAFVRVPMGDLSLCSRALDAGARGVICPMIQNDSDARALSEATKFPPLGRRSWGAPRTLAMSGYTATEFLSAENTSCAALALIETMEALDHVPAILAIEGIDGLYVGPNDLSISLTNGAAIDIDHPSVQRIMQESGSQCKVAWKNCRSSCKYS